MKEILYCVIISWVEEIEMEGKSVVLVVDELPQNVKLLEAYLIPQGYENC